MSEHSKGPWIWEHHPATKEAIAVSTLKGPTVLCRFWPVLADEHLDDDAKLIASAPELLAALQYYRDTAISAHPAEFVNGEVAQKFADMVDAVLDGAK